MGQLMEETVGMIQTEKEVEKRKLLIRTTYKLIAEFGFSNITLQDVADKAGVSKGIILYYFENKDELFASLLEWLVKKIESNIRVEVSKAETPVEKIKAYLNSTFFGIKENREFYKVYLDFLSQSAHDDALRKFNIYFYDQCRQIQTQMIKEGIEQKVFREVDLAESCVVFRSVIDGLNIRWLFDEPEKFDFYKRAALNTILAYLRV